MFVIYIFKHNNLKVLFQIFFFLFCIAFSHAQNKVDSLNRLISKAKSDTQRINLTLEKFHALFNSNLDSAIILGNKTIQEAKAIGYKNGEAKARIALAIGYCFKGEYAMAKENLDISQKILSQIVDSATLAKMYGNYGVMYGMQSKYDSAHMFYKKAIAIAQMQPDKAFLSVVLENTAIAYQQQSNYPQALVYYQKALTISEQINDTEGEAYLNLNMATAFEQIDDTARALQYFFKAVNLAQKLNLKAVESYACANLSSLYGGMNKFKEEYDFGMKAALLAKETGDQGIQSSSLSRAALSLAMQNKFEDAEKLSRQSMIIGDSSNQPLNIYQTYSGMGSILKMQNKFKEAIPYYKKAFLSLTNADLYNKEIGGAYSDLSECYERTGDYKQSLAAYKMSAKITDSIRSKDNVRKATELTLNYEFEKKQQTAKIEQEKKDAVTKRLKNQQYFIIAALGIVVLAVLIIALIQFRNSKQRKRANTLLHQQKQKVESTLSELKSTQAQLIQSEKMASLGELTAGIAHEIQNPLNFVNNFSEVNTELIDELEQEAGKGNIEEVQAIAKDIRENEEKINHHGKRADAIVKNMLQHSRSTLSQKEPTDINALADEHLRLSYHGFRAKDKEFNATIKTDFDEAIGKINIIPQDIGRMLLNLYNNAFYALAEKAKQQTNGYEPVISLYTKKINDKVEITVKDNGNGISQKVVDKIFQPFFTTKPTGQGTGLGLSLSYDIIKAHGGEIKVETKEHEGSQFIIQLPTLE